MASTSGPEASHGLHSPGLEAIRPARHLSALKRTDLSRPVALALRDRLLGPAVSFFDYGCGRGDDVERLISEGYSASGWDPAYRPDCVKRESDVVNLGYVVNVVEDPSERASTLADAWRHARRVLVVAARLKGESRPHRHDAFSDGIVTTRRTFQKFFEHQELRDWIDSTLRTEGVAAAPGVFYVFRSSEERESFVASRFRAKREAPRVRRSDEVWEAYREILEPLRQFLTARGRLPHTSELDVVPEIEQSVGSLRKAFRVIERVTGVEQWEAVRKERARELLVYLALSRFSGRPKASTLPLDLRLDVKAFFGSYKAACQQADALLFSTGDPSTLQRESKASPVGKTAGPALYVHESAMGRLPGVLRVYEGCARSYIGSVEEANIIKLRHDEPKISYLAYPDFEASPHPALATSTTVHLQTFRLRERDFTGRDNPPVLHRKEEFVAEDHPLREKFARLTRQEERHGLLSEEARRIGTRDGWQKLLAEKRFELRGHRLVRPREENPLGDRS